MFCRIHHICADLNHRQYAIINFFNLYRSGHGIIRMFFFHIQAFVRPLFHGRIIVKNCADDTNSTMSSHWSSRGSLWQTFGSLSALSSTSCLLREYSSSARQLLYASRILHGVYLLILSYQTHWVNFGLKSLYLALLALQFVLALGNRPKGERMTYTITLWVDAILAVYLLVCSCWLTALSFKVCLHS